MRTRTRTLAAGALLAALVVGSGAAVAMATGGPSSPGADTATAQPTKQPPAAEHPFAALAQRLGVDEERLQAALGKVKQQTERSGPTSQAGIDIMAQQLGISQEQARTALHQVFGNAAVSSDKRPAPSGFIGQLPERAVQTLASALGISTDRARSLLTRLDALADKPGGINPRSADFRLLAQQLGVTPERLASGLDQMKMSLANG